MAIASGGLPSAVVSGREGSFVFRVLRRKWRTWRSGSDVLEFKRELQELRLQLAERDRTIKQSRAELERLRGGAEQDAQQRARSDMERLVTAMGAPMAQLVTQAHLHRSGAVEIRVEDVLRVGTRLVRALRDAEVDTVGEVGEAEPYDPERHDPLSADEPVATGDQVVVKVVGLSYQGRILRKAGVDREDR